MTSEKVLLDVDDIIQQTGYSRSTVWRLIQARKLKSFKEGHLRRVPASELTRYVARSMRKASAAS